MKGNTARAISDVDFYSAFVQGVVEALSYSSSFGRLSEFLTKFTYLGGKKFSFLDHEYQLDIVNATHYNNVVIKPSQVGLTELICRLVLAFLAVEKNATCMYLLPNLTLLHKIAKGRIDPVVQGSPYLTSLINKGSDSATFKMFGTSQLHMGGTAGKEIISIPTDLLVIDEFDFCDTTNVTTSESRLKASRFKHQIEGEDESVRGIKFRFSTPTATDFGVDQLFNRSNRKHRLVKCMHCGHWFFPHYFTHCRFPTEVWDKPLEDLGYLDAMLIEERKQINTIKLYCPSCQKPITKENLKPPHREWVAECPSVTTLNGFKVSPFDAPEDVTPASLTRKIIEFGSKVSKFRNYELGEAHSDASNSFLINVAKDNTVLQPLLPPYQSPYDNSSTTQIISTNCIAGLDVGDTSWLIIGKINYQTKGIDTIHYERIDRRLATDHLYQTVLARLKQYGVTLLVCDMRPFADVIQRIQAARPEGWVLPNSYTLADTKLAFYKVDDKLNTVASERTELLNYTSAQVNTGKIRFAKHPEIETVYQHLKGTQRVDSTTESGENESRWVKKGDDHFAHALAYLQIAALIQQKTHYTSAPVPTISEVVVGSRYTQQHTPYYGLTPYA